MKSTVFILLLFSAFLYRLDAWQTKVEMTERFVKALPSSIEAEGLIMRRVHVGLLNDLIADSCGTNAIRISDATAIRIKQEGLAFFASAKHGRLESDRNQSAFRNLEWQKLPECSDCSMGESFLMSVFTCAGRSGIPARKIVEGLKAGNGYVSVKSGSEYYMLPDQKLFVQVFID
ncbi:MAG: hypothetical protein AAGA50_22205 [Pseudomonadota bacterium]